MVSLFTLHCPKAFTIIFIAGTLSSGLHPTVHTTIQVFWGVQGGISPLEKGLPPWKSFSPLSFSEFSLGTFNLKIYLKLLTQVMKFWRGTFVYFSSKLHPPPPHLILETVVTPLWSLCLTKPWRSAQILLHLLLLLLVVLSPFSMPVHRSNWQLSFTHSFQCYFLFLPTGGGFHMFSCSIFWLTTVY